MTHPLGTPRAATLIAAAALAAAGWAAPAASAAPADQAFALSGGNLLSFTPNDPASVTTKPITGITAGETLVGIDVRPQNGMLYALGVNPGADTGTVYVIGRTTGVAGVVGTAGSVAFTTDGTTAVDLPGGEYGFDFNPSVDRIRVTTATGLNLRLNPNTGGPVDGNNTGNAAPAVTGINPDGPIGGATTSVAGSAYTNNRPNNGAITTLYSLDPATNALTIQNPANGGTQTAAQPVTVGGAPLDFTAVGGFDIDPAVSAPAANAAVTSGTAYASLTVAGTTRLYAIDLTTGAATAVGTIGDGAAAVEGLALQRDFDDVGYPAVALSDAADQLARFGTSTPSTTTTVALTAPAAGETFVGLAWRPQTGQLFGLAVNSAANTGTLYRVDPQDGSIAVVGTPGSLAWVDETGAAVDLPPVADGWAIDFNPTVDRLRIVADGGLNARANPNNGAAVDGDLGGAAGSVAGTNPDGAHNPLPAGATGVVATAYTNAFAQSLTGGVTTQYVLEPSSNQLFIQNPPNAGGLATPKEVTLNGIALDFGTNASLDIPSDVAVTTSSTPAGGVGIAALNVSGTDGLYAINLTTGAASVLGTPGVGVSAVAVGDAQRDLPTPPPVTPTPVPPPAATPTPTPRPAPPVPDANRKPIVAPINISAQARLVRRAAARVNGRTLDTGYTVTCPGAFLGPCEARVKVTITRPGKLTLATRTIKVEPYRAQRLRVTLTKSGLASLRRNGSLRATVAITGEFGSKGRETTTRRTSTIRR